MISLPTDLKTRRRLAREPDEDKKGSISFTMLVREIIAGHRAAVSA